MKKILATLGVSGALTFGAVDASVLNEKPLERVEQIGDERIEAKQIGNKVETTFPWKDQKGLKVVYDMGEPTVDERIKDKRKKEIIAEMVDFGDGGFKVDVLLNEKPDTNVFCYNIEGAENYDFFYQLPLTEQEIAKGAKRPPEIEGSYAVYHKTLKGHQLGKENYATGKMMHIPRPQVWEVNNEEGTKQWADLSYTEQEGLCVKVSQEFLDTATYPVRVDPTFGYTTLGASDTSICDNTFGANDGYAATAFNLSTTGTLVSLHGELAKSGTVPDAMTMQMSLYDKDGNGANSHVRVASYGSTTTSVTGSGQFFTFPASSEDLSSGDKLLYFACDGSTAVNGGAFIQYDSTGSVFSNTTGSNADGTFAAPPTTPLSLSDGGDYTFSLYATYVEDPGAVAGCEYITSASSGTDTNSYTFTSQALGTAASDRYIVIVTGGRKAGASFTLSSVTVGGQSATIIEQVTNTVTNSDAIGMAIASVPSGTTGDVVVTWSTTLLRSFIGVYRLDNLADPLNPLHTDSTASAPTGGLNTVGGDCAIGAALTAAGSTATWSGITEDFDGVVESFVTYTGAHLPITSASTPLTMTATFGSSNESVGVFGVWGAAAEAGSSAQQQSEFWF